MGRHLLPHFSVGVQTCSLCGNLHDYKKYTCVTTFWVHFSAVSYKKHVALSLSREQCFGDLSDFWKKKFPAVANHF